ncbi:hypothetical protein J4732_09145 [Serratia marcescens]|uniref:Uncharacterized protein n=1 Tax=Serratia marcescens TaxID=615 RepID=A0A939STF6_SERMA|nr:hypothetical protein [Serratia marcescens]
MKSSRPSVSDLSRRLYEYAAIKNQFSFTAINPGKPPLFRSADRDDGHGGAGHYAGDDDGRRLRAGQRLPAAAVSAAELLRLYLFRGAPALIDMENMFDLLQEKREIVDSPMPSRCASIAAKCGSMRSASVTTRAGRSSNR